MKQELIKRVENNIFSLSTPNKFNGKNGFFCNLMVWKERDFIDAFQPNRYFKCDSYSEHIWIDGTIFKVSQLEREEYYKVERELNSNGQYRYFCDFAPVKLKAISQEEYMETLKDEIRGFFTGMHNRVNNFIADLPDDMYESELSHFLNHIECEMTGIYSIKLMPFIYLIH